MTTDGKVTIAIDAVTTSMVGAAKRTTEAAEKSAKTMAGHFANSAASVAKTFIGVQALVQALQAGTQKAAELNQKMASLGAQSGGVALRASQAAARGGFDSASAQAFTTQISAVSPEDRAALLESLASSGVPLDQGRLGQLTGAFSSGAFSSDEVVGAAKSGAKLDVAARLSQLSPEARRELQVRAAADAIAARSRGVSNDGARLGGALTEAGDLANPKTAIARAALGAIDRTGLGEAFGQSNVNDNAANSYLSEIANNTRGKLNMSGAQDTQ